MEKDAVELLNAGFSYGEVSNMLRMSPEEAARIKMENQTRERFLLTVNFQRVAGVMYHI
jgi:hypothetical protein